MDARNNFLDESSNKVKIGPSKTLNTDVICSHKFLYPDLYSDYDITEEKFEILLDLLEEKITEELEKVEKEFNPEKEDMNDDMRKKVEDQFNYLIESGDLFLEAIEQMRMFLECEEEDDEEANEYLITGIEVARKGDRRLRKSLEIFEELRESN